MNLYGRTAHQARSTPSQLRTNAPKFDGLSECAPLELLGKRCFQAAVLTCRAASAQGRSSSIWLRGCPATMRLMTSARYHTRLHKWSVLLDQAIRWRESDGAVRRRAGRIELVDLSESCGQPACSLVNAVSAYAALPSAARMPAPIRAYAQTFVLRFVIRQRDSGKVGSSKPKARAISSGGRARNVGLR